MIINCKPKPKNVRFKYSYCIFPKKYNNQIFWLEPVEIYQVNQACSSAEGLSGFCWVTMGITSIKEVKKDV